MTRPRLLDLFCRKGGAGVGYHRAGFEVVGVDIEDHSDGYPFEFHRGDAIEFVKAHGHEYDAIHASPPCQDNIAITAANRKRPGWTDAHTNLIPPTREALALFDVPTVIENGETKELRRDVTLCGLAFDLKVFRHRWFELEGWTAAPPQHVPHRGHRVRGWRHGVKYDGDMFAVYGDSSSKGSIAEWQTAMGIDWMTTRRDLAEAVPPDYTEHLGRQLMGLL